MEDKKDIFKGLSLQTQVYLKKRWPGAKDADELLVDVEKELKSICWTPFSDNENIDFMTEAPKKAKSSKFMGLVFVLFGLSCLFIVPSPIMGGVYLLFFGGMGALMGKRGSTVAYLLEAYSKLKA